MFFFNSQYNYKKIFRIACMFVSVRVCMGVCVWVSKSSKWTSLAAVDEAEKHQNQHTQQHTDPRRHTGKSILVIAMHVTSMSAFQSSKAQSSPFAIGSGHSYQTDPASYSPLSSPATSSPSGNAYSGLTNRSTAFGKTLLSLILIYQWLISFVSH